MFPPHFYGCTLFSALAALLDGVPALLGVGTLRWSPADTLVPFLDFFRYPRDCVNIRYARLRYERKALYSALSRLSQPVRLLSRPQDLNTVDIACRCLRKTSKRVLTHN